MKISSLTIDERVSGPLSPLPPLLPDCYFSCSRAESQFSPLANLPLCIIKHHMWSTVESRIAFWYFLWPGLCTNVSAHFADRNPTGVARRGEQWPQSPVLKLGCDLRTFILHTGRAETKLELHRCQLFCIKYHGLLHRGTTQSILKPAKCTSFPFFSLYICLDFKIK